MGLLVGNSGTTLSSSNLPKRPIVEGFSTKGQVFDPFYRSMCRFCPLSLFLSKAERVEMKFRVVSVAPPDVWTIRLFLLAGETGGFDPWKLHFSVRVEGQKHNFHQRTSQTSDHWNHSCIQDLVIVFKGWNNKGEAGWCRAELQPPKRSNVWCQNAAKRRVGKRKEECWRLQALWQHWWITTIAITPLRCYSVV